MKDNVKVVKVIDEYKLVINVGTDDGAQVGQKYLVYSIGEEEIFDPDTNESLGHLELVKGTGKITHVQPKMSTIESCEYTKTPIKTVRKNPMLGAWADYTETTETSTVVNPFENPEAGDFAKRIS